MKNYNIFLGIAMTLAAGLTACSSDDSLDNGGKVTVKEAVEFSGNVSNKTTVSTTTRAVGDEIAFKAKTQIVMSIKSDKNGATDTKKADNTTAYVEKQTGTEVRTAVTFTDTEKRYWDDLFGRDALLTVYAAGVEGKTIADIATAVEGRADNKLALDANNKIAWTLSTTQTATTYAVEDLLISNNNRKVSADQDDRLKYQNYAFDKGNLLFKHAMSRITINLKKGDGFKTGEFSSPVVTYKGFYTKATVNAADGSVELPSGAATTDITPIVLTPMEGYNFTYDALVIPSRNWDNEVAATLPVFTIVTDGNTYTVNTTDFNSKATSLTNKLTGEMLAGNQYIFNVTINKSGVEVTASLCDWITNTTAVTPVIVKGTGIGHDFDKSKVTNFDIYRSMDTDKNYGTSETNCKYDATNGFTMTPQMYWPNHEDAYNFRAVAQLNEDGTIYTGTLPAYTKDADTEKNYIDVKTCKKDGTSMVKDGADIIVGAPTESDGSLTPAKKAGDGDINFTFKHALSEVYVQLKTTTGTDKVDLTGAKVEIVNSVTEGQLMAGTNSFGALSDDDITDAYSLGTKYTGTTDDPIKLPGGGTATDNVFRGYTIPQSLTNTNGDVKIKVTTSDGNTYEITAKTNDIAAWKEGNQYLYNLTLKKTGVELTASLIDWLTGKTVDLGVQL